MQDQPQTHGSSGGSYVIGSDGEPTLVERTKPTGTPEPADAPAPAPAAQPSEGAE